MARKKKYKAVVSDEMYMEDLIWMSYRYCIGRKTIAAHSHAGNIARYSFDHISDGRKRFMAKDIREEINDVLRWRKNIDCHDYREDLDQDAMSLIINRLHEKYGSVLPSADIWTKYKFEIANGRLSIEDYNGEVDFESITTVFHDLVPWIKLANALDDRCHRVITTVFKGEKQEHECFPYPTMDYLGTHIDIRWIDINSYRKNPSIDSYIDPQYITEISEPYEERCKSCAV